MTNAIQEYGPYRRKSNVDPLFVTGLGATALVLGVGAAANALKSDHHQNKRPTPILKQGDHFGIKRNPEPGRGVIHAKKGVYNVGGLGTAVTAESHDGGPIIEHTVK